MRSSLDCIPCFVRQTLDAVRRVTDDEVVQEELLRSVLWVISTMDLDDSPPFMGQIIHRTIRNKTGVTDPYAEIKKQFNRDILSMYFMLKSQIDDSINPLETAVRLAIAGNIIDLGAINHVDQSVIHKTIGQALTDPFEWDEANIIELIENAQSILYLTDNAGEIVLDKLLIEYLPIEKITVAVRGLPVLNDATLLDAETIGLSKIVPVLDNGSDVPGTILSDCKAEFVEVFNRADLIIAKGQGNYETLNDVNKDILFLLKAKCPVIARDIGCKTGAMIAKLNSAAIFNS